MDLSKLKEEQKKLARRVMLRDDFSKIQTVAGCDIAYTGNNIICAVVVMDYETLQVRETQTTVSRVQFPYIPGYLAYREAPISIETYHKLELDPDVFLVDGNGILHPRKMGLASALGLSLDKPAVGVAKNLLCGDVVDDTVYLDKEAVGKLIGTKEQAKPIYVSPGHKVGLRTSMEVVKKTLREHKMPEPLHEAHKLANKIRRKLKGKE